MAEKRAYKAVAKKKSNFLLQISRQIFQLSGIQSSEFFQFLDPWRIVRKDCQEIFGNGGNSRIAASQGTQKT